MSETTYEKEWKRQLARTNIPAGHNPVHRWNLRYEQPQSVDAPTPPRDGLSIVRAENPTVDFYRFLYNTAGEDYLWADRRRISDDELKEKIEPETLHLMVLNVSGVPAGFYELDFGRDDATNLNYFALLPGFGGRGLGGFMLTSCVHQAGAASSGSLTVDTCTLDHPIALENYKARGFVFSHGDDETSFDPRLDGIISRHAAPHVPIAR